MLISLLTSGYGFSVTLILLVAVFVSATVSIVVHEISHGYAALLCGDPTAKNAGRLTLNPLAHFDWIGLILLVTVGFGWAKPVPINPNNFKNRKRDIIIVSLAGVASNLAMCGIALLLLWLLFPYLDAMIRIASAIRLLGYLLIYTLEYFIILNLMLAFFNILPIYPLDGFNFIDSLLPYGNKFSIFMRRYGWFVLIAIILLSNVLDYIGLKQYDVFYLVQKLAGSLIGLVTGGKLG
jgi:Zn-dependent protease